MMALSDQEMAMEQFGSGSHITLFPVDITNTDTKALSGAFFFLLFGQMDFPPGIFCQHPKSIHFSYPEQISLNTIRKNSNSEKIQIFFEKDEVLSYNCIQ